MDWGGGACPPPRSSQVLCCLPSVCPLPTRCLPTACALRAWDRGEREAPHLILSLNLQVAVDDDGGAIRGKLLGLEKKYAGVAKKAQPHPDLGCWWTLYDYGLESVKAWDRTYKHPYPGVTRRGARAVARCGQSWAWQSAHTARLLYPSS